MNMCSSERKLLLARVLLVASVTIPYNLTGTFIWLVLPYHAESLGINYEYIARCTYLILLAMWASSFIVGYVISAFGAARVILIGLLLRGLALATYALAAGLGELVLGSLISGIASALVGYSVLSLSASVARSIGAYGIVAQRLCEAAAGISGPVLGSLIASALGFREVFVCAAALLALPMLIIPKLLRQVSVKVEARSLREVVSHLIRWYATDRMLVVALLIGFCQVLCYVVIITYAPILCMHAGLGVEEWGLMLTITNAIYVVVLTTGPKVVQRSKYIQVSLFSLVMLPISLMVLSVAQGFIEMLSALLIYECFGTLAYILPTAIASMRLPKESFTTGIVAFDALMDAGAVLGPLIADLLSSLLGLRLMFFSLSLITLLTAFVAWLTVKSGWRWWKA